MKFAPTILSTRKLNAELSEQASLKGVVVRDINFIQRRTIISDEVDRAIADTCPMIIFTSAHAVRLFTQRWMQIDRKNNIRQVFCLQGETLNEVIKLNITANLTAARDAQELARLIVNQKDVEEVVFFCGNRRRNELPGLLEQHGIRMKEVHLYQTLIHPKPIDFAYEAVLFFSPSAVEAYFQTNLLKPQTPCFCIGHTTAAAVREFTGNPVILSEDHSQQSVLDAVYHHFKSDLKKIKNAGKYKLDTRKR